jgi:hypothetical protein
VRVILSFKCSIDLGYRQHFTHCALWEIIDNDLRSPAPPLFLAIHLAIAEQTGKRILKSIPLDSMDLWHEMEHCWWHGSHDLMLSVRLRQSKTLTRYTSTVTHVASMSME